jgi:hypothetical protein
MKHRKHPSTPGPKDRPAPEPVDLASESVAGEEDPGAALDDDPIAPARRDAPATGPDKLKPQRPR